MLIIISLFSMLTDGEDFSAQVDISSLYFPAASEDGALLYVGFNIYEDLCFEKNHSFSVHINTTEDNVNIGPITYTEVIIIDNEGKPSFYLSGCIPWKHHIIQYLEWTSLSLSTLSRRVMGK